MNAVHDMGEREKIESLTTAQWPANEADGYSDRQEFEATLSRARRPGRVPEARVAQPGGVKREARMLDCNLYDPAILRSMAPETSILMNTQIM